MKSAPQITSLGAPNFVNKLMDSSIIGPAMFSSELVTLRRRVKLAFRSIWPIELDLELKPRPQLELELELGAGQAVPIPVPV